MIIHVVAFRWKDGVPPGHVATVKTQLAEFAASLPEVKSYRLGNDVKVSDMQNFDFAIVAEFDSVDDWRV
ncbi:MAG: Dabb family protein, partial [Ilumatobacteraceae bacterium]